MEDREVAVRLRKSRFVVLALAGITIVLTGGAWFLAPISDNSISSTAYSSLWVCVLFIALASFIFRRMLFTWDRLRRVALIKGVSGLLSVLERNTIFLASLGGAVAVIGFVIAVMSGSKFEALRASAVALIVIYLNYPRSYIWQRIISSAEKIEGMENRT
jgi:hypothetical protein